MVEYLQIYNKEYLDILNPMVSEMVIGTESHYSIRDCLVSKCDLYNHLEERDKA